MQILQILMKLFVNKHQMIWIQMLLTNPVSCLETLKAQSTSSLVRRGGQSRIVDDIWRSALKV